MNKQRVVVNIYNEEYTLKSDLSEERVQKLAEYVDKRMQRIANSQPALSSARIAVLVALELADEAITGKESYEELLSAFRSNFVAE